MNIKRILLLASMALAAIAFAVPVAAQAEVTLTDPNELPLEPGAKVTLTSTNLLTTFLAGSIHLKCAKFTFHYEVEVNTGEHVVLQPVGAHNGTTEQCRVQTTAFPEEHPIFLGNVGTNEVTIDTWGTGSAAITFTRFTCAFSGEVHIQATGGGSISIGPSTLSASGCPIGTMHGNASLETSDGTPVSIDFEATP